MPRRSSSGRSGGGGYGRSGGGSYYRSSSYGRPSSSPRYSTYGTSQRSPNTSHQNTMPINPQRGMGLGGALATGMAFGGGSAIGHTLIGGLMGHRAGHGEMTASSNYSQIDPYAQPQQLAMQEQQTQQQIKKNPCEEFGIRFVECLKEHPNDISKCQNIMDDIKNCEKSLI